MEIEQSSAGNFLVELGIYSKISGQYEMKSMMIDSFDFAI